MFSFSTNGVSLGWGYVFEWTISDIRHSGVGSRSVWENLFENYQYL